MLVLALLVAVGWLSGYGIGRGVGWVRDVWPDPEPRLVADKVAAPEPADDSGPVRACPASSLTLTAVPDTVRVQPGQAVTFDVSITNSGRRPCLVDGGDASRRLVVTDAEAAVVWSSAHCSTAARNLLLGPGDVRRDTLRWNGRPSVEGSCTTGQSPVAPGTFTAQVVMADVQGAKSTPVQITVEAPPPPPEPTPDPTSSPTPTPTTTPTTTPTAEPPASPGPEQPPADPAATTAVAPD